MCRYVGNIPWNTDTEALHQLFSQYGEVQDTFIPTVLTSLASRQLPNASLAWLTTALCKAFSRFMNC